MLLQNDTFHEFTLVLLPSPKNRTPNCSDEGVHKTLITRLLFDEMQTYLHTTRIYIEEHKLLTQKEISLRLRLSNNFV